MGIVKCFLIPGGMPPNAATDNKFAQATGTSHDFMATFRQIGCTRQTGHSALTGNIMANSQKKSNKEVRKPKAEKKKTNASEPSLKSGTVRGLENMKNG